MAFEIIRNDITKVKADAIVNTANPKPVIGGGTDSAIYEAAGKELLLAERKKIGSINRGDAVETPAFNLQAKYIIHTVGPVWNGGDSNELEILKNCYENSLNLALKLKCKSIAFPLIATGVYNFPKDKALQVAMSAIQAFLMEHEMKVILVVFGKKAFELSGKVIDNIREYVDANYVEEAKKREYLCDDEPYPRNLSQAQIYERRLQRNRRYRDEIEEEEIEASVIEETPKSSAYIKPPKIDDLLASSDKTFQEKLFEIIDERGLTAPQVYNGYVSKQVFSKIQCDKDYHPNKYTAIALCLSLHLSVDDTLDLIGRAGWTLSSSSKADLVVKGCILNKEYNKVKINCILFDYDCPELEKIK